MASPIEPTSADGTLVALVNHTAMERGQGETMKRLEALKKDLACPNIARAFIDAAAGCDPVDIVGALSVMLAEAQKDLDELMGR